MPPIGTPLAPVAVSALKAGPLGGDGEEPFFTTLAERAGFHGGHSYIHERISNRWHPPPSAIEQTQACRTYSCPPGLDVEILDIQAMAEHVRWM
jgi:hypothetical protein